MFGFFGPSTPKVDYQDLWQTYSRWQKEDEQRYERELSSAKARMIGGGIREGSTAWEQQISAIEQKRQEREESLQSGPTYKALQSEFERSQRQRVTRTAEPFGYISPFEYGSEESARAPSGGSPRQAIEGVLNYQPNYAVGRDVAVERPSAERVKEAQTAMQKIEEIEDETMSDYFTTLYGEGSAPAAAVAVDAEGRRRAAGSERALGSIWMRST